MPPDLPMPSPSSTQGTKEHPGREGNPGPVGHPGPALADARPKLPTGALAESGGAEAQVARDAAAPGRAAGRDAEAVRAGPDPSGPVACDPARPSRARPWL